MNTAQAKQIPIADILSKLNYSPKKTKSNEIWYLSPFRKEKTPSFKVDLKLNLWYDYGNKEGGTTIDLIMKLYNFTISEALKELSNLTGYISHSSANTYLKTQKTSVLTANQEDFEEKENPITQIKPLKHQALLDYLASRNINIEIAKHYLQEVHYQINNNNYFAIGFKNDSGGFELRNKTFKGSLKNSKKDITTIINPNEESKTLLIFEGFIDFFSLFTVKNFITHAELKDDVIILNSLSFLDKTINFINQNKESYCQIHLYLDNDESGKQAVNKIMFLVNTQVVDMSYLYQGRKDLNELILI